MIHYRGPLAEMMEIINIAAVFRDWGFGNDESLALGIVAYNVWRNPERFR